MCGTCLRVGKPRRRWKPPLAVCAVCELERPCYFARSERPICVACRWRELHPPRFATLRECIACREVRKIQLRLGDDGECERCNRRRMRRRIDCEQCGEKRRPSARDPRCCEPCAGEVVRQLCVACGAEDRNHTAGRCARCSLAEILRRLRADGDPAAIARLEPYLQALANGPQPWTTLKWMLRSRAYETVVELAAGTRAISHDALDGVDRGQTTLFLRAALVTHGVLEPRPEQSAKLARATQAALPRLAPGEDRAHVRAFAIWQVPHDLARRERRGQTTRKSARSSIGYMRAAVELALWTHARGLTLGTLRQEELDRWLAAGSSATVMIRPFLRWAVRGGLMAPLVAPIPAPRRHTDPLDSETRLLHVKRLLGDEDLDLRDRVGGCLVLLYGQPISRILMLTCDRVSATGQPIVIHLGNTPLELPEPLGQLTATLARERAARASTAAAASTPPWLFPGMRLGAPLDETYFRRRLKRLGITPLSARTGALIALAAALPPTILADLLGMSESGASNWYRLASGEWARYAAEKARRFRGVSA